MMERVSKNSDFLIIFYDKAIFLAPRTMETVVLTDMHPIYKIDFITLPNNVILTLKLSDELVTVFVCVKD